jgi:phosphoglycolate phosphatase
VLALPEVWTVVSVVLFVQIECRHPPLLLIPMSAPCFSLPATLDGLPRRIKHAVFDFDGTLSWLRHGWPGMMLDVFEAHLPVVEPPAREVVRAELLRLVMALNGKPTIFQIHAFGHYASERGLSVPAAEPLRRAYQDLLDQHIAERTERIRQKTVAEDAYVVAGARQLLESLRSRGVRLSVLSSTVEHRVQEEAGLLGLASYFEGRIYGSPADPSGFTKRAVFEEILRTEGMGGEGLLAFGDGPEEMASASGLGGIAIAVCTDEHVNGSGECDPLKREQLLEAGAHAAIPDFIPATDLLAPLFAS